ncbi:hypothetical protein J5X84_28710 [Streptosporangiaceae bacterium NEAU-GS5]|nr:hypothetical protein [Streptosporangiaceae bacterium NEAU-GS5]
MSIKRRVLLLAGTTATAGAILAGAAGAAHADTSHTLKALANICVTAGSSTACGNLTNTTVVLTGTTPVLRDLEVKNGVFTGQMEIKYQMDAAGVVRHQLVFARLLKNGKFVVGTANVQATVVKPGANPSQLSGVGSASGGGGAMSDGATTQIVI